MVEYFTIKCRYLVIVYLFIIVEVLCFMLLWDRYFGMVEWSFLDNFSRKVGHFDDGLDNYSEIVVLG